MDIINLKLTLLSRKIIKCYYKEQDDEHFKKSNKVSIIRNKVFRDNNQNTICTRWKIAVKKVLCENWRWYNMGYFLRVSCDGFISPKRLKVYIATQWVRKNNILIRMSHMVCKTLWEFAFLFVNVTQFHCAPFAAAYAMKNSIYHSI